MFGHAHSLGAIALKGPPGGGLPALPNGYAFLVDSTGAYLVDSTGAYLIVLA